MKKIRSILHAMGHLFLNIDTGVRMEGKDMFCKQCGRKLT